MLTALKLFHCIMYMWLNAACLLAVAQNATCQLCEKRVLRWVLHWSRLAYLYRATTNYKTCCRKRCYVTAWQSLWRVYSSVLRSATVTATCVFTKYIQQEKYQWLTTFTMFSMVSAGTFALIAAWFVDTGSPVLTRTDLTFVYVYRWCTEKRNDAF